MCTTRNICTDRHPATLQSSWGGLAVWWWRAATGRHGVDALSTSFSFQQIAVVHVFVLRVCAGSRLPGAGGLGACEEMQGRELRHQYITAKRCRSLSWHHHLMSTVLFLLPLTNTSCLLPSPVRAGVLVTLLMHLSTALQQPGLQQSPALFRLCVWLQKSQHRVCRNGFLLSIV